MPEAGLKAALSSVAARIEARIGRETVPVAGAIPAAMMHAVKGGKALRGFLVCETARLHAVPDMAAIDAAAAIEAMHAYSLVHDDLPCMDDDDLRRGQPTVHKKWDEATAVLTGDALQALAFELLGEVPHAADMMRRLARAAGMHGMVGGQAMDIAAEAAVTPLTLAQISALQAGKTGALITWSATAGPAMAGDDPAPLAAYGDAIGLAFQIADDLLDVTGNAAEVGKAVGKDASAGKATFVSLLGVQGAQDRAAELVTRACDALAVYGDDAALLKDCARFVIARRS